ncbi:MAG: cation:proton antiporter [Aquificae bacterium]|nr:cation:proton antiporter [Aquificota bacterium]
MEHHHLLPQIAPYLLLLIMFFASVLLRKLSIPSIIAFMLVGFGAKFFIKPEQVEQFELFKHAGIILLFFFIGLEYSFEKLKTMFGAWKTGTVDFIFNFIPPFLLAYAWGFDLFSALVLASVFYPSSTSIIAKLLMDFKRIATPEAELLIGILIFEDLVAILLLALLIPLKEAGEVDVSLLPLSIAKVVGAFLAFYLVHRFVVPRVNRWLDEVSEEDVFVFFTLGLVLTVGVGFHAMGLSEALGAFLLGVIVPETRVFENIEKKLSDLKELSIGLFFFFFAYETELALPKEVGFLVLLVVLAVVLKVISTYVAGYLFGLKKRARLRAALSFVPRGEFSVIMSSLQPSLKTITIPFIMLTAFIGSILFVLAPKIADRIYPPKRPRKKRRFRKPKRGSLSAPQAFGELPRQAPQVKSASSPPREPPPS